MLFGPSHFGKYTSFANQTGHPNDHHISGKKQTGTIQKIKMLHLLFFDVQSNTSRNQDETCYFLRRFGNCENFGNQANNSISRKRSKHIRYISQIGKQDRGACISRTVSGRKNRKRHKMCYLLACPWTYKSLERKTRRSNVRILLGKKKHEYSSKRKQRL